MTTLLEAILNLLLNLDILENVVDSNLFLIILIKFKYEF